MYVGLLEGLSYKLHALLKMQRYVKCLFILPGNVLVVLDQWSRMAYHVPLGAWENGAYFQFFNNWIENTFDGDGVLGGLDVAQVQGALLGMGRGDDALDVFGPLFSSLGRVVVKIFRSWVGGVSHCAKNKFIVYTRSYVKF
jgi:hypothetical protein